MINVLITGASGFVGSSIRSKLDDPRLMVRTLGRSKINDLSIDLKNVCDFDFDPNVLIHCAGLAHVKSTTRIDEEDMFEKVNFVGTKNLLKPLKNKLNLKLVIFISSVSVYGINSGININEEVIPSPKDLYGRSKLLAENYISTWCIENNIAYITLRLPLVVGHNPPGNLSLLIEGIRNYKYLRISDNTAIKSIVCLDDLGMLIKRLILESEEYESDVFNLCTGDSISFRKIEDLILLNCNNKFPLLAFPKSIINLLVNCLDFIRFAFFRNPVSLKSKIEKMTTSLTFCDNKARQKLKWNSSDPERCFLNIF